MTIGTKGTPADSELIQIKEDVVMRCQPAKVSRRNYHTRRRVSWHYN